ncbi:hypothetical protein HK103_001035 [Boothiomyces macroporosus]|uniref:Uncharacterized protein n=1 Tax=Boothiomyces macroporosus TaxID=261099 RepID=A0AAD5Y3C5_9FUNG|nr:hypothetical protein HK103_001035 [Boothiomyces macroporosus]
MQKVVILTGSSKGIGFSILKELLNANSIVVGCGRSPANYSHPNYHYVQVDLSVPSSAFTLYNETIKKYNHIDSVIHNAGIIQFQNIKDIDTQQLALLFQINLFSGMELVKHCLPELRKNHGSVILVSSGAAVRPVVGWGAYCTSKAALNSFASILGVEEPLVATVAVRPGVVDTEMQTDIRKQGGGIMSENEHSKFVGLKENGGLIDPSEPARKIAHLALHPNLDLSGKFVDHANYIGVAGGSVLLSIPISALGLPFILSIGIVSFVIAVIMKWIVQAWLNTILFSLRLVKTIMFSPTYLLQYAGSMLRKMVMSLYQKKKEEVPLVDIRRHSTSSRYTDRSEDLRWKYIENEEFRSQKIHIPSVTQYEDYQQNISPRLSSPSVCSASSFREFERVLTSLEPMFLDLTPEDHARIDVCYQLYSLTTGTPVDRFEILIGHQRTGNEHHVLSLWNQADNSDIDLSKLIGFCEYFSVRDKPGQINIDKLNVSTTYADRGFSKKIIRKLMYLPGVTSIQVWSVWGAESFYKSLGFRNVLKYGEGGRPRRVDGDYGPLLIWNHSQERVRDSFSLNIHELRSKESIGSIRKENALNSKSSMSSLVDGIGAYTQKPTV